LPAHLIGSAGHGSEVKRAVQKALGKTVALGPGLRVCTLGRERGVESAT
jgi:hypothetical protein